MGAGSISWLLAQTFWVGGLWLLHFVVLPGLEKMGLAPMLVDEAGAALRPLLVGFAGFCGVLQLAVLLQATGWRRLLADLRGQLLLTVLLGSLVFFAVREFLPQQQLLLMFSYLVLAFCGLLLILQPLPRGGRGRQRLG